MNDIRYRFNLLHSQGALRSSFDSHSAERSHEDEVEVTTECLPLNSAHIKARGLEGFTHEVDNSPPEPAKRYITTGKAGTDLEEFFK